MPATSVTDNIDVTRDIAGTRVIQDRHFVDRLDSTVVSVQHVAYLDSCIKQSSKHRNGVDKKDELYCNFYMTP